MKFVSQKIPQLFVIISIPLHLQSWIPTPISGQLPIVSQSKQEWLVSTKNTAGGFAYLLPDSPPSIRAKLTWEWKVTNFPISKIELPFTKDKDDFALRIGVLISDGTSMTVPACLKDIVSKSKLPISYVVFYLASPSTSPELCGASPFTDRILYCMKHALFTFSRINVSPIRDLDSSAFSKVNKSAEKIVGLWVFADSDNSHSSSQAVIKRLEFTEGEKDK